MNKNKLINDMLKNVADPRLQRMYGEIINRKIVKNVYCMSEDIYGIEHVPVLDKDGNPKMYTKGKRKGQVITEEKEVIVRQGCNDRLIATIDTNGKVDETDMVISDDGRILSGLEGSRLRLDGRYGFRCFCGNVSVLSEEEKGVITSVQPTQEDLGLIAERLGKRKTNKYPKVAGVRYVDGFRVEDV